MSFDVSIVVQKQNSEIFNYCMVHVEVWTSMDVFFLTYLPLNLSIKHLLDNF